MCDLCPIYAVNGFSAVWLYVSLPLCAIKLLINSAKRELWSWCAASSAGKNKTL